MDEEFLNEIENKFKLEYNKKSEKEIKDMVKTMKECLDPSFKHLLTVCPATNLNAEIDVAILNALLQAVKRKQLTDIDSVQANKLVQKKGRHLEYDNKYQKQLHLALDWNRADIARKFIFTDELSDKVKIDLNKFN